MRSHDLMSRLMAAAFLPTASGLLACSAASSQRIPVVEISGQFAEDGSCTVRADGAPLYSASETARTIYIRDRALNMAPAGYEVHEIWCAPMANGEPMLPDSAGERAFFLNVYVPSGQLAPARSYIVRHGIPTDRDQADIPRRATAALFGARSADRVVTKLHAGVDYLAAVTGTLMLTRVDSSHVVGVFKLRAVPEWSM